VQAARKINEAIRGFPVSTEWAEMFNDKTEDRAFCATGNGGGIDNSCGGGSYDPGHFDIGPDPNGLTEKDLMYSPTVKWTQNHESLVRDAVKSWKGSPTDMTLHVMSELNGEEMPNSGSGKIMRAQATALLKEVAENGEPAPKLYRGASIPPEKDPSPLLGWTSKKSVATAFAKKNNGEVYTLEGASGLDTSKIKAHGMGEAEWIVPHNIPGGTGMTVSQDAEGKDSYWLNGKTFNTQYYSLEDKQTGGRATLKVGAYHDYSDGDFSAKATHVNIVTWSATPMSEIAAHGLIAQDKYKGKGFGRSVMQEAMKIADKHGATVLSIFAPSDDSQAVMKHYTKTGLLDPIPSSKAVRGDFFTSFNINKDKAAAFTKSKPSKRAFCPNGTGGGVSNTCGAKVMMAPDGAGGGGTAKTATVNKGVKPSSPLSPKNRRSWMNPSGDFYPVASEETHNAWAAANTSGGKLAEAEYYEVEELAGEHLFKSGWLRVTDSPDAFYIDTTSKREPSGVQKKNAIDFAIHSGSYDEVLLTNDGWIKKTLWRKSDDRAFCPNGKGNGITNTCRVGINVNDESQDFTGQILSGAKTTETRITNSLKPYIGQNVGIVRTGKGKATLVGTMKVGEPKFYSTPEEFDADFDKHQIDKDSPHYIGPQGKFGYPLSEVKPLKPVELPPGGRIARVLHKSKRELTVEFDLGGESPEHPKQSRSSDCGRDDDGRFSSGNKCGGQVDMPKEDPKGRMRYDNGVQTDAARKLYQMGTSEKKLKGLVEALGGDTANTRADINPPSVDISVADKDGEKLFHIEVQNGRARLYPTKNLSDEQLAVVKDAASEAFAGRRIDTKIQVFSKASDMKSWEKENASKIKKWEDKYAFSTLLPPHQRPKKWERSIDARYASLLAFAESRDCGQDPDGKFSKGNTCASGIAADAAKGAAAGAALGAIAGFAKSFMPQVAASNAAIGAVAGAVKGIYDNQMRPTRVSERITKLGMTDEGIANIVKSLGGSKDSVASTTGRARLTVKIKDREGKVTHVLDFTKKTLTIYPKKAGKELTDSELQAVKEIAKDNAPKQTKFTVKTDSLSYVKRIARNGFEVSANKAGIVIATAASAAFGPAVPDFVGGLSDFYFDTHFTDSFYRNPHAKR
jgi:GNAT superfamily N-acetyltransferase